MSELTKKAEKLNDYAKKHGHTLLIIADDQEESIILHTGSTRKTVNLLKIAIEHSRDLFFLLRTAIIKAKEKNLDKDGESL